MSEQISDRIRFLQSRNLEPDEKKLADDIIRFGCHIIQIKPENGIPGWSYTVGLYELFRLPEIVVIGLKENLAHFVLNEVARRQKGEIRFTDGHRESGLIENVDCEFRIVEKQWRRQIMGYAIWFYGDDNFPVMQCVYPDLDNHFPSEPNFDSSWRSRQPQLFQSARKTVLEEDFWAANDPRSSIFDWKFPVPPHTGVYTTKRIMDGKEPILSVYHDAEDGAWQFHGPSDSSIESASLVCFHHITDKDKTIAELADLPVGWCAKRETPTAPWVRELHPTDPENR